jgi:hypothetical protein
LDDALKIITFNARGIFMSNMIMDSNLDVMALSIGKAIIQEMLFQKTLSVTDEKRLYKIAEDCIKSYQKAEDLNLPKEHVEETCEQDSKELEKKEKLEGRSKLTKLWPTQPDVTNVWPLSNVLDLYIDADSPTYKTDWGFSRNKKDWGFSRNKKAIR